MYFNYGAFDSKHPHVYTEHKHLKFMKNFKVRSSLGSSAVEVVTSECW